MQTKILILLAVFALGVAVSRAEDEPTPADKKPTIEQARKTYEAADARLTIAYKEAGAGLDQGKMKELRQSERDWIVHRDGVIKADFGSETATKHTAEYWKAMTHYAQERMKFLRAYAGKSTPDAAQAAPQAAATPPAEPATTPAEKPTLDQARKTFEATDALLTTAYKEAGAGLDPRKMLELRQSERDWIQYRETLAKSAPYFNNAAQTDSPKGTVDYWQTMDDISRARIDFLRAWTGKKVAAGITGEYSDSHGGTLELEEKKSGLAFSISTVRGMARNEGNIDGVAQRTGEKACYKDHPDAGDDRAPCEITLTFIEGHIVKVEEKNGDYYHGFNANFDGLYYKTGKLEKPPKPE